MDASLIVALTGLVAGILGGIASLYVALKNARQTDANTEQIKASVKKTELDILKESLAKEIERLQKRVDEQEKENAELHRRVNMLELKYGREHEYVLRLQAYIAQLLKMMRDAGLTPPPMPEPINDEKLGDMGQDGRSK